MELIGPDAQIDIGWWIKSFDFLMATTGVQLK